MQNPLEWLPLVEQAEAKLIVNLRAEVAANVTGLPAAVRSAVAAETSRIIADFEKQEQRRTEVLRKLASGRTDLVPLAFLVESQATREYLEETDRDSHNRAFEEGARECVRALKRAILAGRITLRTRSGVPCGQSLRWWCDEDETLKSLHEFMPHSRLMVRVSDAREWWLSEVGYDIPPYLQIVPGGSTPPESSESSEAELAPADEVREVAVPARAPEVDCERHESGLTTTNAPSNEKRRTGFTKAVFAACEAVRPRPGQTLKDAVTEYLAEDKDETGFILSTGPRYTFAWAAKGGDRTADEGSLDTAIREWRAEKKRLGGARMAEGGTRETKVE